MADYFLRLPESLIHHILSFLPFKEIGRTCVLSKYFNSIWCNYPNLDFYLMNREFKNWASVRLLQLKNPEQFICFDGVENSLDQCLVRRPFIQQLRLQIFFLEVNNFTPKLDRWLGLLVDKNVSRLVLIILHQSWVVGYSVPQQVFVARTLEVLELTSCSLEEDRIVHIELPRLEKLSLSRCQFVGDNLLQKIVCASHKMKHISLSRCRGRGGCSLSVPEQVLVARTLEVLDLSWCTLEEDRFVRIELPCLEKLSLSRCYFVGDNLLQKILCASPKMKNISLSECKGLGSSLSVSCTPLLKHFLLRCGNEFERIKIDAPSLQTFSYESHNVACAIDLTSCTHLKELCMYDGVGTVLEHLQSIFPGIQVLELHSCCSRKKYKISSQSLERLILHGSHRFNDVEIDAPNLQSFEFSLENYLSSKFKFSSWSIPKADDIHMKFSAQGFRRACRAGLQDFLMKLPNYEDLKLLIFNEPTDCNLIMIKELHAVSFSSLQKFAKKSRIEDIFISSRDETNLVHKLSKKYLRYGSTISMICSSWQSAESFCKKLGNWSIVQDNYGLIIELVSPAEIQMSSAWESFVKSNSRGINQSAAIILHASKGSIQ